MRIGLRSGRTYEPVFEVLDCHIEGDTIRLAVVDPRTNSPIGEETIVSKADFSAYVARESLTENPRHFKAPNGWEFQFEIDHAAFRFLCPNAPERGFAVDKANIRLAVNEEK
jgi:hypothetical protein